MGQQWLDDEQQRTWRAWLTLAELLPRTLDAQLQRDAGISTRPTSSRNVLSEGRPNRGRRMSDLARRANQSQSRLSHTVTRLNAAGCAASAPPRTGGAHSRCSPTPAGTSSARWRPVTWTPSARPCSGRSPTSRRASSVRRADGDRRAPRSRPQPAGEARRGRPLRAVGKPRCSRGVGAGDVRLPAPAPVRPRARHRRHGAVLRRCPGPHHRGGPGRRPARLHPPLGRRAPQHAGRGVHEPARAHRPPGGCDRADQGRFGRRDAAQPRAARRRRAVRAAGGAAPRPHRPGDRPRARH